MPWDCAGVAIQGGRKNSNMEVVTNGEMVCESLSLAAG